LPGYKSARIACDLCGEGINYDREVIREEVNGGVVVRQTLCQGCAFPGARYYQVL
jgi:formylmethanofuran dehydrogenase subunit E